MEVEAGRKKRAAVVVLGDIGRSPRMQYHSLSLANQAGMEVDIVANGGSDPHLSLRENPSIHIHEMKSVQLPGISKISGALALLLKAAIQFIMLVWFLCFKIPCPDVFIVQNPPSVPTLAAVKLVSWIRGAKFIVDWHNFGYTLLGLSHGRSHIVVKIYFWFEKHFGQMADGAFCVTKAMQHELAQNWGIKATVLYDHSPEFFHPASLAEKHELFSRLGNTICSAMGSADCISVGMLFSNSNQLDIFSWTPDEDFSILLEAALMYDRRVAATLGEEDSMDEGQLWIDIKNGKQFSYPRLLFIITGKGPDRKKYEEQVKRLKLRRVAFRTMWLASEDYPLLLGSADLGVSLHTSSSGLDLPMKVVDMFGCGLPVCAASFSCIEELVKVNINGLLFSTSSELADELMMLFKGFPEECDTLKSLKDGALSTGSSSKWSTEWETYALPLVNQVIG
ncbi:UDP-glycosyltransferase TURAN isoform X2 [Brachypodium distachyon]|uniref:UDP-glycosyltransferase TURAN isoform X2 n=1 Tax=Brachypodium distachyon TaxID=15368 RepID=UPI000D0D7A26|nr:UDP-glycosyltransferase TURAN isoform X2 [Brachypodium distachyon]|eukprot:XP_024313451.1 UDP-glycosyltransferase TURAN isoform X2 [Brachypodium distachyon]